jgi:hypothetical protein
MKFLRPILFILTLISFAAMPGLATEQERSDRVVGYWVSSSGTEMGIAYSGDPSTFLVQIRPGSHSAVSYVATWHSPDGVRFSYKTSDGSTINGWVNDANSISVFNPETDWKAEWTRR